MSDIVVELQGGSPAKYYASAQLAVTLAQQAQSACDEILTECDEAKADCDQARTDSASSAAIAAAAAALISDAAISFTVDASLVVRPESHGGTDGTALAAAFAAASVAAGVVALSPGGIYTTNHEIVVPSGIKIFGPRSATLKLPNQITTSLSSGFSAGTGAITFAVANASQFVVGQSVMFVNVATSTVSPNDSFSHAGRQISVINYGTNSVTVAAGPNVNAHAAGDIMASTSHMLLLSGDNVLEGFTVDGNVTNQTYGHWWTSAMLAQQGDRCHFRNLHLQNSVSDAILVGGPSGSDIVGSYVIGCEFDNIGSNGVHYGNVRKVVGIGNRMKGGNMRCTLPVEQGGGGTGLRGGHQDGAFTYSNDVGDGIFTANNITDWICGFGAMGSTPAAGQTNDDTIIFGNTITNCEHPAEVTSTTKRVVFAVNKCVADIPFAAVNGTAGSSDNRWTDQRVYFVGDQTIGRVQHAIIADNIVKNGSIHVDRVYGGRVGGNIIDNRAMNSSANSTNTYFGLQLYNYEALSVKGNIVNGGFYSLWLQNSNLGVNYSRESIIEGNHFMNAYQRAVAGALTSPATFEGTILRGNFMSARNSATQEDGTTALTYQAAWKGIGTYKGLQIENNRVDFDISGAAAFDTTPDAATAARRHWNVVNGLRELPPAAVNDAAAATANVPVGGFYINGSALQQRVS